MPRFSRNVYYFGSILIVAAAIAYIFWGGDILPEAFLRQVGPVALLSYLDDAIVLIGMVFALRNWKAYWLPEKKGSKINWGVGAVWTAIFAIVLWYVFWGVDLIPDQVPWVGFMDDAAAVFGGMVVAARLRKFLKPRG